MSISALNWAFNLRDVSISQKLVLISLANFSDESGYSFPAIKTIAEMSCMSTASVRRALADLGERGILRIDHRFRADGSQTSSGYFLEIAPPVNLTPPPRTVTPPPITGDTPYNHHITTTSTDTNVSVRAKRKCRIKLDWALSDDEWNYASSKGLSQKEIEDEADKFRDHYLSSGSTWLDWSLVWKRWVRESIKRREAKGRTQRPVSNGSQPLSRADIQIRRIKEAQGFGDGWGT